MMSSYLTIRIILSAVFAIIILIFMLNKKKLKMLNLIGFVAIFFALISLLPAENLIMSFETPSEAMEYIEPETVTDEIIAEDFAVLVYKKNINAFDVFVTQKGNNGYKLPFILNNNVESIELPYEYPNLTVKLCKSSSSEKAMLIIIEYNALLEDNRYEFTDSQGNEFIQLEKRTVGEDGETVVAIYHAEISLTDDYQFTLKDDDVEDIIELK